MTKTVARNTLYLTIASVGQKILSFVYFMMIARIMKVESTGAYFLAISLMMIFSVIADAGLQPVIIREVAKAQTRARELLRTIIAMKLPFTLLAVVGLNAAALLLGYDADVRLLIALASMILVFDSIALTCYGVLRGFQMIRYEAIGIIIGQFIIVSFGFAVLFVSPKLELLIIALASGSAFGAVYSALIVGSKLGWNALIPKANFEMMSKTFFIALPFFLAAIFVKVYSYIDTVFLSVFIGASAVGIYSIAYKLTYSFQFLPMAFVAALYPGMSELMIHDKKRLAELFNDAIWYMAVISVPIVFGLWAIADEVVLLAGGEFAESAAVLKVLIFVLIPIFLDFPIGSLLNAADRQATKTAIMGGTMVINAVLNAILIPTIGIMGAAIAAVVSFVFLFGAGVYFVPQIIPYKRLNIFRVTVPIIIVGALMAALTVALKPHFGLILVILLAAVFYVIGLVATRSLRVEHLKHAARLLKRDSYETNPPPES